MDSSDACLLGLTYTGCLIASSSGSQLHRHNCWFLKKAFSNNSGLVNCCPLLTLGLYPTLWGHTQLKNNPGIKDGTEPVCHHVPGSPMSDIQDKEGVQTTAANLGWALASSVTCQQHTGRM